jgi:hypothetical protein
MGWIDRQRGYSVYYLYTMFMNLHCTKRNETIESVDFASFAGASKQALPVQLASTPPFRLPPHYVY